MDKMNPTERQYGSPNACNLGKPTVWEAAELFAANVGFEPGGDIREVVAKLNGKINFQDSWEMGGSEDGSILIDGVRDFQIFVGSYVSPERSRFTIAHELGHYVLHYLLPKHQGIQVGRLKARRYGGTDRTEYEANWFAAAFLMPAQGFKDAFQEFDGDMVEVADRFQVSISAATVRAKTLGLR